MTSVVYRQSFTEEPWTDGCAQKKASPVLLPLESTAESLIELKTASYTQLKDHQLRGTVAPPATFKRAASSTQLKYRQLHWNKINSNTASYSEKKGDRQL